ncbi:hypothetical protein KY363_07535 [Candidatus Woesearchaeota archaeon]|nr:hypothetical protein [Candidatus Woesearchaeota archaeon]
MGIHGFKGRYEAAIRHVGKAGISGRNQQLVLDFVDSLVLEGLSRSRLAKYMGTMVQVAKRIGRDLDVASESDVKKFVGQVQMSTYSPWTKHDYKVVIRRFYKWLLKTPGKEYPAIVSWISIRISRAEMPLPSDGELLKPDEVTKLIDAADHPRDKAFISVLWESGARVSEVGNLHHRTHILRKPGP